MARYSQKFKERVVARLLPPESSPVEAVSQTVGISVGTLERWRAEVLAKPSGDEARHWTPAARLEAVIATAAMNQAARSAWCREHGVYPTELETWKQDAIGGLGEPPLCQRSCRLNRIGTLGARIAESGSIRTSVQRSDGGEAVAAGEFGDRLGVA